MKIRLIGKCNWVCLWRCATIRYMKSYWYIFLLPLKLQIISQILLTIVGSISLILRPFIKFAPWNDHVWLILVILTPKMVEYIFKIIFILTAAKNYTSNLLDTPFGPDYCTSSNASLTATSNSSYFQNILNFWLIFHNLFSIKFY